MTTIALLFWGTLRILALNNGFQLMVIYNATRQHMPRAFGCCHMSLVEVSGQKDTLPNP